MSSSSDHLTISDDCSFNGEPGDEDVCFGKKNHPGTVDCRKVVRRYIKSHPDDSYGPDVFNRIKKKLKGRHFLTRDDRKSPWKEAKKREVISFVGEMWKAEKKKSEE